MRVLHLGSIAACLLALACSEGAGVPSEAETIDQFTRDRTGFEATVRTVTAEPRILRIERQPNGELLVLPAGTNSDRVASVASFMERHGIVYVSTDRAPEPSVDFTTFEHFGDRYGSRMLTYRPDGPSGNLAASTDEEIRRNPAADVTVFRSLGDDWYLRASSLGARP